MFEFFDHTADLGIRVQAPTLNELFADAGQGLMAAIVENPQAVRPCVQESIRLTAPDLIDLMFDWLRELLIRFEVRGMLWSDFQVEVAGTSLTASLRGESCDHSRHRLSHEVKAITYHGLIVEQQPGGWLAEVIVDI